MGDVDMHEVGPYAPGATVVPFAPAPGPAGTARGATLPESGRGRSSDAKAAGSPAQAMRDLSFAAHLSEVKAAVDHELQHVIGVRIDAARRHGAVLEVVIDAVRSLSVRGGKRFRPALLSAAYDACGGDGGTRAVVLAGVALELLQTYLLIHDDWMDEDTIRRGGPTVHMMLAESFGSRAMGDASAILAGDHAAAMALETLLRTPLPAERVRDAAIEFARIQEDVVFGQLLDVHAGAQDSASVERMHELKTGSYTVRGPLAMGAILAGATAAQRETLGRFAGPLGVAFQLRDDLLGTFGDPAATGKPAGNDIRQGKRTALVAELDGDATAAALFPRALGVRDAPQADVDAVVAHMAASGAKARVEARVAMLLRSALDALEGAPLLPRGKALLVGAVHALGDRER